MIVEAIVRAFFSVLKFLLSPINLPSLDPEMFNSIHQMLGYIGGNSLSLVWLLLPRGVVMTIFVILLLVVAAFNAYKMIMWIIKKIPGGMS